MTQVASSKTERPPRDERESLPGSVVPWDQQGRLFSQLFAGDGNREGSSRSLKASTVSTDLALFEAFAEQLVPRLNTATQWPLQAAFFLPRLGRVDVCARREQGAWYVEMAAEEERTRAWLGDLRQHCQDRLSAGLGLPVQLSLAEATRP